MSGNRNRLGQPVGAPLPGWRPPRFPRREAMEGRYARLEPLDPEHHAADLYEANALDAEGRNWTYLPYGPFESLDAYRAWMREACEGSDPLFFAIADRSIAKPLGVASTCASFPPAGPSRWVTFITPRD